MKTSICQTMALAGLLLSGGSARAAVLVLNHESTATIVVDPGASDRVRTAAQTLQKYVEKSTGAILPISDHPAGGVAINVGATAYVRQHDPRPAGLDEDGFVLDGTGAGNVSIVGGSDWGTEFGVDEFLERAGPDACTECHELKAETAQATAMLHAATRPSDSKSLREHDHLPFQTGPYAYQLLTTPEKSTLTVSNASSSLSVDLLWALGSGHLGQTFLYEKSAKFYESRLSFYNASQSLDITPGQSRSVPATLDDAVGRAIPPNEARLCFGCHTTASTTNNLFDPSTSYPGVTCEACHGPGSQHIAAARAKTEKRGSGLIVNPAQLARVDSVDFCGACHRTWQDVISGHMIEAGVFNVRFAPYRLENSRCWVEGDARITCTACHDPHKPLSHAAASYDANCLACHRAKTEEPKSANHPGAACLVATKNCVNCHMLKVEPPNLHSTFTDHWIRNPSSSYPE